MTERVRQLRALDQLDARPMWTEIERRTPGPEAPPPVNPWRRVGVVVASLAIAAAAIALPLAMWANRGAPPAGPSIVPAPTEQVIGYHGLLVTVPASWKINDTTCGTPVGDTIVRDQGAVTTCNIPRPKGISSVELANPASWLPNLRVAETFSNGNGVRIERGSVPGRPGLTVYVPSVDVLMFVDTVTAKETNAILDSIALSDTDPNGCAMREMQLTPNPRQNEQVTGTADVVIPGTPTAVAICHYVDNWLASSAKVTGQEMVDLVTVINAVPEGFAYAPSDTYLHSTCHKSSAQGGERGSGYILHVEGDGTPSVLWAHVGICGPLGVSNGERNGQLTPALAKALNEPLHHGYGMPGHLVVNPSG